MGRGRQPLISQSEDLPLDVPRSRAQGRLAARPLELRLRLRVLVRRLHGARVACRLGRRLSKSGLERVSSRPVSPWGLLARGLSPVRHTPCPGRPKQRFFSAKILWQREVRAPLLSPRSSRKSKYSGHLVSMEYYTYNGHLFITPYIEVLGALTLPTRNAPCPRRPRLVCVEEVVGDPSLRERPPVRPRCVGPGGCEGPCFVQHEVVVDEETLVI